MSCSNTPINAGNLGCDNFYMEDKKIIYGLLPETLIRLSQKGWYPIKSDIGYMFFQKKDGSLIGSSITNSEIDKWIVTKPKDNMNLTEQEIKELKALNLL